MYSSLLPSRFHVAGKFTQPRRFVFSKYELSRVIAAAENPAPPAAHHGSLRCNGRFAVADLDEADWPSLLSMDLLHPALVHSGPRHQTVPGPVQKPTKVSR
ncbi:hypothetical protein AcV7_002781 [Taiwanofungus camphoratus]|nr:hypothetical protein AcV7_002781 [Antrodia cinnamomea]